MEARIAENEFGRYTLHSNARFVMYVCTYHNVFILNFKSVSSRRSPPFFVLLAVPCLVLYCLALSRRAVPLLHQGRTHTKIVSATSQRPVLF